MEDRRPSTPGPDWPGQNRNRRRNQSKDRVDNNQQDGNSQREGQNSRRGASSGNSNEGQDRNNPRRNSDQGRGGNQGSQNQQRGGNKQFRGNQNNTNARGRDRPQSGGRDPRQETGFHPNMEHGPSYAPARDNMNQQGACYDPRSGPGYQPSMRGGFPPGGGPNMGGGQFQPPLFVPLMGQQWAPPGMPPNNPGYNNIGQGYPQNYVGQMNENPRYPFNQQPAPRYPAGNGLLPTPPPFQQPPPSLFHDPYSPGGGTQSSTNHGGNQGGYLGGNRDGNHGRNRGGNLGGNRGRNLGGNRDGYHGGNRGGNSGGNRGGNYGGNRGGSRGNQRGMPKNRNDQEHFENQPLTRSSSNMSINSIQSEPGGNRGRRSNRGSSYRSNGDRSNEGHRRQQNDTHSARRMDTSYDKPGEDNETVPKQRQYNEFGNDRNYRTGIEGSLNNRTRGRGLRDECGRFGFRRRGGRGPRRGYGYGRGGGYMGLKKKEDDEASQTGSDTGSSFSDVSSVVNDADQHNVVEQRISDFLNGLGRGGISRFSRGRAIQNRGHGEIRGRGRFNKRNFDGQRNERGMIGSDNENSSTVGLEHGNDKVGRESKLNGPERRKMNRGGGRGRFDPRKRHVGNRRHESVERSDSDKEEVEHQNNLDIEDASDDENNATVNDVESKVKVKRTRHRKRRDKSKQEDDDNSESDKNVTDVGFSHFETTTDSNDARENNDDDLASLSLQTLQNRRKRYKMRLSERLTQGVDRIELQNRREQIKAIEIELERRKTNRAENERETTSDPKVSHDDSETESEESSSSNKHIALHRRVKSFRTGKGKMSFNPSAGKTKIKTAHVIAAKTCFSSSVETNANDGPVQKNENGSIKNKRERKKSTEYTKPIAKDSEMKFKTDNLTAALSKLDQLIFSDTKVTSVESPEANKKSKTKQEKMLSKNVGKKTYDEEKGKPIEEKDDCKSKTSCGIRKIPIETEVFSFLVKHMDGFGDPNDIKRECGMFETEFNVEPYFRARRTFFVTLERGQHVTHVFAFMQKMSYCADYCQAEGCLKADCKMYHVCKDMVYGNCRFGSRCKHSHNFLDEWNGKITKDLGLTGRFNNKEIKTILSCRQPHVCDDWPFENSCTNEYCPKLHICPRFIIDKCVDNESCPLGHDFMSQHNKPIMAAYRMAKRQPNIVKSLVYIKRNLSEERNEVKDCPPVSVPVGMEEQFELVGKPLDMVSFPEEAATTERMLYERDGVPKVSARTGRNRLLVMEDASSKFICMKHIHGNCNQGNCTRLHSDEPLPYLWQVKLFGDWVTVEDSESVEQHFCTPGMRSQTCIVTNAEQTVTCVVEFGQEITASLMDHLVNKKVDARRLTTMSFKEAGDIAYSFVTQWRWYWLDNDGKWKLFEPDSLQHTLEAKFLAKQPTYMYSRENYKWKYMIEFAAMTQRNMDTSVVRQLRRRPLFVSYRDVQDNKTPPCLAPPQVIEVELPPSWVPWDVAHPFELVQLSHRDTEFIEVSDNFYKTMSRHQHILDAVFRVQNHALLSAFCNHEKTMSNNQLRLGDRNPVDKRELFHGTDSLDIVRGICINNFDFRLCGKNATLYGHGAYFARDAKYSHSYTKPSTTLERFMFQAKVLVGYFTTGDREYKRPPGKPGKDHELYDSCVDKVVDPSIFILFEKNAYYPEYLIQYNFTGDKGTPIDVSPPIPRRSVHASLSSSSISSSAIQPRPLQPAPTTAAPAASQHSYAAPQPFTYPSSSSSSSPIYAPHCSAFRK